MKLRNYKWKSVISVDHTILEELIEEVYGVEYEIMPMEEVGSSQYAAKCIRDVKRGKLKTNEKSLIKKLVKGSPIKYSLGTIMKDLCNNDYIVEGEYIINVSW
jgi:spore germination protein GerM